MPAQGTLGIKFTRRISIEFLTTGKPSCCRRPTPTPTPTPTPGALPGAGYPNPAQPLTTFYLPRYIPSLGHYSVRYYAVTATARYYNRTEALKSRVRTVDIPVLPIQYLTTYPYHTLPYYLSRGLLLLPILDWAGLDGLDRCDGTAAVLKTASYDDFESTVPARMARQ
ncbi:hypothetical protein VTL71DRAFT_8215 [Oculimacula yallundae]|uniref:Uncharacterized protein n=1 Tax=Oculimacula yallundae TaxID=86028 RepID=A0ABR4CX73_9HELO